MTEEQRLHKLEGPFMDRKLITSGNEGVDQVQAHFPPLPKEQRSLPIADRISNLEKLHQDFRIIGGSNVTVAGSLKTGYAICATCPEQDQGTGGAINIPPAVYGACCFDNGSCSVTTQIACTSAMGTYQGDGTDCDPNPCPQPTTGACCVGSDCTIETEADCTGMGGTYQGDDTTCDPNPCATGACCHSDGSCSITTEAECDGDYQGDDTLCEDVDCPVSGACCLPFGGGCEIDTESDCTNFGGTYLGNGTTCESEGACCKCFHSPQDGMFYCNKTVRAVVTGSNPLGCDCTLTADFTSTFECDPETGGITPGCSGTWHKVVSLTTGHICVPSDVTDNWEFQTDCSGADRCGWNSSCGNPDGDDCCGGLGIPNPCGVADLSTYTDDCSYTCCDAQPGCLDIEITVTYS